MLVIFYEDLVADPSAFIVSVYRFLRWIRLSATQLGGARESARTARIEAIAWLVYRAWCCAVRTANLSLREAERALLNRLLYRPRPAANDDARWRSRHSGGGAPGGEWPSRGAYRYPLPEHWHG